MIEAGFVACYLLVGVLTARLSVLMHDSYGERMEFDSPWDALLFVVGWPAVVLLIGGVSLLYGVMRLAGWKPADVHNSGTAE